MTNVARERIAVLKLNFMHECKIYPPLLFPTNLCTYEKQTVNVALKGAFKNVTSHEPIKCLAITKGTDVSHLKKIQNNEIFF